MSSDFFRNLLSFALELADGSGQILQRYFRSPLIIEEKKDLSPVTLADRETELFLRDKIRLYFPSHSILGEEFGREDKDDEFLWVIDPIDGTKSLISGNPLFGTLIALLYQQKPLIGVIDLPALGQRWWALRGEESLCHDPFRGRGILRAKVRARDRISDTVGLCTSPDLFSEEGKKKLARLQSSCKFFLYGGDCFCYTQLAGGYADLVAEEGLSPYDFLALIPVIEGAGGKITDWEGNPLSLASNGSVLATGNDTIHQSALKLLRGSSSN